MPRPASMFAVQRRERILDVIRSEGQVTVAGLSQDFAVTEVTVRRDLAALSDQGLLTRVHGGATVRSALDRTVPRTPGPTPRYRVGMVVPTMSYYWPEVIVGARAAAVGAQAQLVLRGATYEARDQRRQLEALVGSAAVHALVVAVATAGEDGAGTLAWLDALPLPVVLVERQAPRALALRRLGSVGTDHAFGAAVAVHHLHEQGHRRIGLVAPASSPTVAALRRGWLDALADLGLDDGEPVEHPVPDHTQTGGDPRWAELVSRCRATGTTALLVHSDPEAVDLAGYCHDHRVAIPGELALIAYDDEFAADAEQPITAMRPPRAHLGRLAVEMACARLTDPGRPVERLLALPDLVVRSSSGPPS